MNKITDWFESLEQRERLLVTIGAVFVLLTLFYLLLLEPTAHRLKQAKSKYLSAQQQLAFMQETHSTAERLKKQPQLGAKQIIAPENLLSYLDSSMKRYRINTQLNSISPAKDNGANLRFDNVEYNKLMQWLGNLYFQNGINVESINIAPTKNPGMVKATMLLM